MIPANTYDYLIIGQGLTGTVLAEQLLNQGCSLQIIDNGHQHSSSVVAAGVINPIVGKRLTIHPQFTDFWETADEYYSSIAKTCKRDFFKRISIVRYLQNDQEIAILKKRFQDPRYQKYITSYQPKDRDFGSFTISPCAIVDTKSFLSTLRNWFLEQNAYRSEQFDYQQLHSSTDGFTYCGNHYKRVISCEGWKVTENPLWQHLPMAPARGSIISTSLSAQEPIGYNQKGWCMPTIDKYYKIGSSFSWNPTNEVPTQSEYIHLTKLLHLHPELDEKHITKIECGVRPSSRSAEPIIEVHPDYPNYFALNGFGSRGTLWIPRSIKKFISEML